MILKHNIDIRRKWTKLSRLIDGQTLPTRKMISFKTLSYLVVNNQQTRGTRVQASVIYCT